ncbi:hypothetical protein [Sphingomonas abaci]|uniref:Uncharacterized protein n=1 Tax=Sphingomonas abaci TaxID=237611 RepID=A0A7W7AIQ6_9SPHN|nr:hypothetical protein [Sphingomonas abaci]MBB4616950.1 hypothetical protein [Sphingomonas abaci]
MTDTTTDAAEARATACTLGVGCDQYGVCYAQAHGQPDQCGATETRPASLRVALERSLAKRSQGGMDPPWTAAFNAALDMVARDVAPFLATAEAASGAGEREGYVLPCDVHLPPATVIKAGCSLAALKLAMEVEHRPRHFKAHPLASLPPATDPAMVTVPREPTEAMIAAWESASPAAGWDALQDMSDEDANRALVRAEWSAMLAAAPTIPATGEAVPEGMNPWHGGDTAPSDWDGGPVMWIERAGLVRVGLKQAEQPWTHGAENWFDIIAYTPKATIPATGHAATEGEGA